MTFRVNQSVNQSLAKTAASVNYPSAPPPRLTQIDAPFSSRLSRDRESFLGCWIPYPGGTPCALTCFFHDVIGLPQGKNGSASRVFCPTNYDFSQVRVSRMQIFLDVPASKFALPPDRSYRCEYCCRAAGDFTSGPIVLCCLHTHRIC